MIELSSTDILFWGLKSYSECESLQALAWERVSLEQSNGIILAGEIKTTITQGVRGKPEDILNAPSEVPVFKINRGGETTLHSEGQLVIYPILPLKRLKMGVREFVHSLLLISEKTFQSFGVPVTMSEKPVGLFSEVGKIGFCGLQIKNGISQHGIALNIQNNLSEFNSIVSCGLNQCRYDKLENYDSEVSVENFFNRWVETAYLEGILQKNQNQALSLNRLDQTSSKSF